MADFETTTLVDDCRVWGWGLVDLRSCEYPDDVEIGGDLDSFIDRISRVNSICYFHNLKFDGTFIIDWLYRNGYKHQSGKHAGPGEFQTMISSMGQFYTITVLWGDGKKTEFRDSLKKLPYSVSVIAKAFKLPEGKGKIDYHAPRPVGHVVTNDEAHYIAMDVLIVAAALKIQIAAGMKKLTVGSDSLAEYKKLVGSSAFTNMFPILSTYIDDDIRLSYRGGWTYAAERFKGKKLGHGKTYDVNSLYPSVMRNKLLPYGEPVFRGGAPTPTDTHPLFIANITFTAKLKKNHVPCIQVKGSTRFVATEYQTNITEPTSMMVTSVDLELWQDHYDLDILSYNGAWMFRATRGMFNEYIDKWMKIKIESTGGMKALAKLHLNSLYGKFATNPDVTGKVPVFEDNRVKFKMGDPETRDPIYTAMGSFITAYARDITVRAAQANYNTFAYADTDSLHLLLGPDEQPIGLDVDPDKLGAWKYEYSFQSAIFVRAKTYIEHLLPEYWKTYEDADGVEHVREHETHVAGLSVRIAEQLTMDNFRAGVEFDGNLKQKIVPGGIVLVDAGFKLPVW